ncbi:hypothetical protein EB796_006434 [Bugula neritina]|uniref:Uncharacterized protein n=1 Tax=Bugula neritina TaxID=10212 RepID=A0A7J7KCK4_BUGNE|nr:hypothetical protein EB796_006434 [Bugula neritina]
MRVTFLAALALMALVAISYAQEAETGSGEADKTTGKTPKDDSGENEQAKKNDNGKQSKKVCFLPDLKKKKKAKNNDNKKGKDSEESACDLPEADVAVVVEKLSNMCDFNATTVAPKSPSTPQLTEATTPPTTVATTTAGRRRRAVTANTAAPDQTGTPPSREGSSKSPKDDKDDEEKDMSDALVKCALKWLEDEECKVPEEDAVVKNADAFCQCAVSKNKKEKDDKADKKDKKGKKKKEDKKDKKDKESKKDKKTRNLKDKKDKESKKDKTTNLDKESQV